MLRRRSLGSSNRLAHPDQSRISKAAESLPPRRRENPNHKPRPDTQSREQTARHGYPTAPAVGPPADPARQPREPARKLLPEVLHVPRHDVAAPELRGRRRQPAQEDTLRLPQDRGLRAGQDGGGARRRRPARPHHQPERDAHPPPPRHRREADAPEPYVAAPCAFTPPPSSPSSVPSHCPFPPSLPVLSPASTIRRERGSR